MDPLAVCEEGIAGVEHIGSFIESVASVRTEGGNQGAIDYLLSDGAAPIYECFARRQVFVSPTLVVYTAVARSRFGNDSLPRAYDDFIADVERITLRFYAAGVPLLAGSDVSDLEEGPRLEPGSSLLDELVMLEESGVTPLDVIAAATINPARAVGADDRTGSIAEGKKADFILLSADPGITAANFKSLIATYQNGIEVYRASAARRLLK